MHTRNTTCTASLAWNAQDTYIKGFPVSEKKPFCSQRALNKTVVKQDN